MGRTARRRRKARRWKHLNRANSTETIMRTILSGGVLHSPYPIGKGGTTRRFEGIYQSVKRPQLTPLVDSLKRMTPTGTKTERWGGESLIFGVTR